MPSARIAPSTPMVEIIYRVQDIPESTVFNVDIGRMRVSNAELEEEENYLHNFAKYNTLDSLFQYFYCIVNIFYNNKNEKYDYICLFLNKILFYLYKHIPYSSYITLKSLFVGIIFIFTSVF